MLIAKHNKRQEMQEELLVSLSMKEMGEGDVASGFFLSYDRKQPIAQYVLTYF